MKRSHVTFSNQCHPLFAENMALTSTKNNTYFAYDVNNRNIVVWTSPLCISEMHQSRKTLSWVRHNFAHKIGHLSSYEIRYSLKSIHCIRTTMAALREYLWIAVCGGILGFAYGFLIGANDVANAFASSVSSKSVTLKQAVGTFDTTQTLLSRTDNSSRSCNIL
jgi:hypothetical protein